MSEKYYIEARSWKIPEQSYLPTVAGHNFWVLRDSNHKIIAQLHGLATDRKTGEIMAIGYSEEDHSLRVKHTSSSTYMIRPDQDYVTVFAGSEQEARARWNAAVNAIPYLNSKDLNYPSGGVKITNKTINSNSTYRTLGEIMDLPIYNFPSVIEPGLENRMISPKEIDNLKYKKPKNIGRTVTTHTPFTKA